MADNSSDDKDQKAKEGDESPAVYSVGHTDGKPTFSRRSFLELSAVAMGATALSSGHTTPAQAAQTGPALAHKDAVFALAINTNGKLLASGDKKGNIKLWQLPEGALLHSWSGDSEPIADLAFPREEDVLWSLSSSGKLKRWRLPDGKEISAKTPFGRCKEFAVPNTDWYAVKLHSNDIELRSQTTGEKLRSIEGLDDSALVIDVSKDGSLILVGGLHGNLGLWTQSGLNHVLTVKAGPAAVSALALDPNGTLALSANNDGSLRTWDLPELREGRTFKAKAGEVFSVAIRPQLDIFAVGSEKKEIELWKMTGVATGPALLKGHTAAVRATAITPDGLLLVSGSEDKTIRLWSLPDGKYLRNLVDLESNYKHVEGKSYQGTDVYGRTVTFTLPCGSPIPSGMICTCNCVPGTMTFPKNHSQKYDSHGACTCNLICTCNTVCTCQGVGSGRYVSYWYPN